MAPMRPFLTYKSAHREFGRGEGVGRMRSGQPLFGTCPGAHVGSNGLSLM